MSEKCKECGCVCARCTKNNNKNNDVHLHAEIEHLRQSLKEKDNHIVKMETQFLNDADKFPNGELASMEEEIHTWQEKYTRLCEAHKRVQKVNQNLEDKLLKIVDKCQTEKGALANDIATLSHRLAEANYTIHRLSQDNTKYRNDVNLAIQLLQCKPSNFIGQKYDSLPSEVQAKVKNYVAQKRRSSDQSQSQDVKSITVPISTFPPTAMVYNITKTTAEKHSDDESDDDKAPVDIVSAAIMAKVLEDRERERIFAKHCDTCVCHKAILMIDSETQTNFNYQNDNNRNINTINYGTRLTDDGKRQILNKVGVCTKINQNAQIKVERQTKSNNNNNNNNININNSTAIMKSLTRTDDCDDNANANNDEDSNKLHPKLSQLDNINPVDIINDRIWKNNWSKSKLDITDNKINDNFSPSIRKTNDTHLDIINERVWKKESSLNINTSNQVTLIEVTNAVNNYYQTSDVAVSPSFSSDSVVISSSEPSSSSSDLIQSNTDKRKLINNINNNNNNNINSNNNSSSNSSNKERLTGPRNCFIRVSREGSKNILLDNAGHFQTVLYTNPSSASGSANQTNTALVHSSSKSIHSGRSLSTSSDETMPILPNDPTQLQRVAEWVQTSSSRQPINLKSPTKIDKQNINNNNSDLIPPCTLIQMPINDQVDLINETPSVKASTGFDVIVDCENVETNPLSVNPVGGIREVDIEKPVDVEVKDLISFDSTNEDEEEEEEKDKNEKSPEYDVKITKEMEENYLKLAASLDPVSLRLSTFANADLTIEKYRKNYKKLYSQKSHDKSCNTTT